ncbi:DUF4886 domain-containing protein [Clostridium sp. 19966]|uniref:DUF4886 domain-containing protein n=1 Tax=Clostridium sp. 19966 TaxID=2768166 RepID=UPI0028DE4B4E|nr:DUF4886 domain-containing protein [Clostridium sp. 19966]MDT8717109.1 DUF4886 domain-containing protein [Clostridium sp. 19966]
MEKKIKILAIGNSFSEDATHYLHKIAQAGGIDTKIVNLYIGGCPLETHWKNIQENARLYMYQINGTATDNYVSIKDALQEEEWDFVIIQQASHDSGLEETYYPYIEQLFQYIKENTSHAEILIHQTWAYEIDSTHDCFGRYHKNQQEMYEMLKKAYAKAADKLEIRIIPCGDVIQEARKKEPFIYEKGGISLCRDGFHMHYIYGRYLTAATWYEVILGKNILENTYVPETIFSPDANVDLKALSVIKDTVHSVIKG